MHPGSDGREDGEPSGIWGKQATQRYKRDLEPTTKPPRIERNDDSLNRAAPCTYCQEDTPGLYVACEEPGNRQARVGKHSFHEYLQIRAWVVSLQKQRTSSKRCDGARGCEA